MNKLIIFALKIFDYLLIYIRSKNLDNINKNKSISLYGAGTITKALIEENTYSIKTIYDKYEDTTKIANISIFNLSKIDKNDFDYIVITPKSKELTISQELKYNYKIPYSKMVFIDKNNISEFNTLLYYLSYPIFIALKAISLIRKIVFIDARFDALGNSIAITESIISRKKYDKKVYILYSDTKKRRTDANSYFIKRIKSKLRFTPILRNSTFIELLKKGNMKFNYFIDSHSYPIIPNHFPQLEPAYITFDSKEKQEMESLLEKINLKNDFFCFHIRDNIFRDDNPQQLKTSVRNSDANLYISTCKEFAETLDTQAVRIGAIAKDRFEENDYIIDYTNSGIRKESLDFFISSKMKFLFVGATGALFLSFSTRKPILFNSHIYSTISWSILSKSSIVLPKKIKYKKTGKYLSLKEYLKIFGNEYDIGKDELKFKELNLEVCENSKEEILQTLLEINARIEKKYKENEEEKILQEQFWKIQKNNKKILDAEMKTLWFDKEEFYKFHFDNLKNKLNIRISSYFLKNNPWFLEE